MTPSGFFATTGNWKCEDPSSDSWKELKFHMNRVITGRLGPRVSGDGAVAVDKTEVASVLIVSLRLSTLRLEASLESGEGWIHTFRVSEVDLKLTEGNLGLWERGDAARQTFSSCDACRNAAAPLSADAEAQELAFLTNLDAAGLWTTL